MKSLPVFGATRRSTALSIVLMTMCAFGGASRLYSQDIPTLSVDVKVINVLASVRTKHGDIVKNLTKDDFTLTEDGRSQTIKYFSQQSDLPLTLGLLVDTSPSQQRVLGQERDASVIFLDELLRLDRDNVFILHFDFDVELLQDLTSSRQKLRAALDELEIGDRSGSQPGGGSRGRSGGGSRGGVGIGWPGGGMGWPGGGRRQGGSGGGGGGGGRSGGGTNLYDAVYLASNELMSKQQGRKAVIILSDGVDTGSKLTLADAIESAQRADTLVYSILFSDASAYGGGGFGFPGGMGGGRRGGGMPFPQAGPEDGKRVMQQLAQETGGRFFEVSGKHPIEQIYASIQEELRNQYSIGYSSDKPYDGTFRKIRLTMKSKDLIVQAREGFYARK
jgi:VWFA-related protein